VVDNSPLSLTLGDSSYGYVAYYAKKILTPEDNQSIFETTEDGFVFYFNNSDNKWYLFSYNGDAENVILPDNHNGENYLLSSYCFAGSASIKSFTLPTFITSIPAYAFASCSNLEEIELPEQLVSVSESAFYRASRVKRIVFNAKKITSSS
jgi:hypothetical protein